MPQTKDRKKAILNVAVAEYIRTGVPVSSDDLKRRFRLQESSATIRNELADLAEDGYLFQPHTSAGRVPTDRGYRWYVEQLRTSEKEPSGEELRALRGLARNLQDFSQFFRVSSRFFAEAVEALAIAGSLEDKSEPFFKSGFRELLSQPEFSNRGVLNNFGELLDSLDNQMRKLIEDEDFATPHVFIGKEIPMREAEPYSLIVKTLTNGKETGMIAILGAKRMRYDRGLRLLQAMDELFD